jgi:hypothetical protein
MNIFLNFQNGFFTVYIPHLLSQLQDPEDRIQESSAQRKCLYVWGKLSAILAEELDPITLPSLSSWEKKHQARLDTLYSTLFTSTTKNQTEDAAVPGSNPAPLTVSWNMTVYHLKSKSQHVRRLCLSKKQFKKQNKKNKNIWALSACAS